MESADPGAGMVPVQRAGLVTRDMDAIADRIRRQYVEHWARFPCLDLTGQAAGALLET